MTDTPDVEWLTKAEYGQRRGVSLSTVDRMIREGSLEVERIPHGRTHRILVRLNGSGDTVDHITDSRLDDGYDVSDTTGDMPDAQLVAALDQIKDLEAVNEQQRGWLQDAD